MLDKTLKIRKLSNFLIRKLLNVSNRFSSNRRAKPSLFTDLLQTKNQRLGTLDLVNLSSLTHGLLDDVTIIVVILRHRKQNTTDSAFVLANSHYYYYDEE